MRATAAASASSTLDPATLSPDALFELWNKSTGSFVAGRTTVTLAGGDVSLLGAQAGGTLTARQTTAGDRPANTTNFGLVLGHSPGDPADWYLKLRNAANSADASLVYAGVFTTFFIAQPGEAIPPLVPLGGTCGMKIGVGDVTSFELADGSGRSIDTGSSLLSENTRAICFIFRDADDQIYGWSSSQSVSGKQVGDGRLTGNFDIRYLGRYDSFSGGTPVFTDVTSGHEVFGSYPVLLTDQQMQGIAAFYGFTLA